MSDAARAAQDVDAVRWAEAIAAGDRRAIARAITAIENETAAAGPLRAALSGRSGHARVIGVTGPPGAGKSTLVERADRRVPGARRARGVVAVDPSSPVTGGAVLGDRVRMTEHLADERVFIRSLAARGHLGGLTRTTRGARSARCGRRSTSCCVETVGVGQSEVEIARVAATRVVVCPPQLGDEVQAMKAGLFEIADIFVVNKADLPGAAPAEQAAAHAGRAARTRRLDAGGGAHRGDDRGGRARTGRADRAPRRQIVDI